MSRDESGTLQRLKAHRITCVEPVLAANSGRIVKLMGDGLLVEFASAVDALRAAIQLQQATPEANAGNAAADPIIFRIGVHLGDLLVRATISTATPSTSPRASRRRRRPAGCSSLRR